MLDVRATTLRLLGKDVARSTDAGLATGLAGEAIALDRLGRHLDIDVREALITRVLRALELCNEGAAGIGFLSGVVGVAWAFASMPARLDANELAGVLATIDDLVASQLDAEPRAGGYELGDGDAGLALFALRRLPHAAARHALVRFVARLEETAEARAGGLAWRADTSRFADHALPDDAPIFVLGRAHGIAGLLGPLAYTMRAGIEIERCRRLLVGAVRFLLASCPPSPAGEPRFPFVLAGATPVHVARFGWCSGDPGVAESLAIAGTALGDFTIVEAARQIAVDAARLAMHRSDDATTLCCGVAGRAMLFARLACACSEPKLGDAAARERSQLAAARDDNDGLFSGAAGTALAQLDDGWAFELG